MPHIIIEYNHPASTALPMERLVSAIHDAAMAHPAMPIGGIRTRAYGGGIAKVGDGAPDNGFIYITVRLGQGRSEATKRDIGDKLFSTLSDFTQPHFDAGHPLSLGLEIQEIEKDWTWKKNNIHQIIKDKNNGE